MRFVIQCPQDSFSTLIKITLFMNVKSLFGGKHEDPGPSEEETEATRTRANAVGVEAQFDLGLMYRQGEGVAQDDVEAYKWLSVAVTCAPASEQKRFAEMRDSFSKNLTSEQRAEGQKRAREWIAAHPRE